MAVVDPGVVAVVEIHRQIGRSTARSTEEEGAAARSVGEEVTTAGSVEEEVTVAGSGERKREE